MANKLIETSGSHRRTSPGNNDWYYGNDNPAWPNMAAALAGVTGDMREGKTVGVLVDGVITEYWWPNPDALGDNDIVLKGVVEELPAGPFANRAAALAAIPAERRYGHTVGIIEGNYVVEYWWEEGTTDAHLVDKFSPYVRKSDRYILITHANFLLAVAQSTLKPEAAYQITDYFTNYNIYGTTEVGTPGPIEPLRIRALTTNTYDTRNVTSASYPKDLIEYDPTIVLCADGVTPCRGRILYRQDLATGNAAPDDWRVVKFRRYLLAPTAYDATKTYVRTHTYDGSRRKSYSSWDLMLAPDGHAYSPLKDSVAPATSYAHVTTGGHHYSNPNWHRSLHAKSAKFDWKVSAFKTTCNLGLIAIPVDNTQYRDYPAFATVTADGVTVTGVGLMTNMVIGRLANNANWRMANNVVINYGTGVNSKNLTLGADSVDNTFIANTINTSKFGARCTENLFAFLGTSGISDINVGDDCYRNGSSGSTNTGAIMLKNTIGNRCQQNFFGYAIVENIIGSEMRRNQYTGNFRLNQVEDNFLHNSIGTLFYGNRCGQYFYGNQIESDFASNECLDEVQQAVFGRAFMNNKLRQTSWNPPPYNAVFGIEVQRNQFLGDMLTTTLNGFNGYIADRFQDNIINGNCTGINILATDVKNNYFAGRADKLTINAGVIFQSNYITQPLSNHTITTSVSHATVQYKSPGGLIYYSVIDELGVIETKQLI